MSLYNRYRPNTFEEMFGNETMLAVLKADLKKPDPPHAILLMGPLGSGKTSLSRIIAKELGCHPTDFEELNAGVFRGIDTVREVNQKSQYQPLHGPCRVWLWDEFALLGSVAAPAMLKMLEDPPKHVYHIMATTDPEKLLPTILSRCSQYKVSLLSDTEMYRLLRSIVQKEGQSLSKDVYDQIILDSQGHPRNALQILDQVLAVDEDKRLIIARKSAEATSQVIELSRALLNRSGWKKVSQILKGLKDEDPEKVRRAVLGYAHSVILNGENDLAAVILEEFMEPTYNSGWSCISYACYKVVKK